MTSEISEREIFSAFFLSFSLSLFLVSVAIEEKTSTSNKWKSAAIRVTMKHIACDQLPNKRRRGKQIVKLPRISFPTGNQINHR